MPADSNSESSSDDSERGREDGNRKAGLFDGARLIVGTAFDAYFSQVLSSSQTSSNVFSNLVQPLTSEEYSVALTSSSQPAVPCVSATCHQSAHMRFMRELQEGFNLLFYGMGSKRVAINRFASEVCSKKGHVIVVNAFLPNFTLKELFSAIEQIPGVTDLPLPSGGVDKQTRRISDFFTETGTKTRLFLIIHNIDAPTLRSAKAKTCLSLLASNPHIHLIASVDRINAPLLWSSTESFVRKQHGDKGGDRRGYAWLWHDLTTLAAYGAELAHADRSSITGVATLYSNAARQQQDTGASVVAGASMTETAATHILASVTQKAKKLFILLGTKQVESMDEAADTMGANAQQYALAYDLLFNLARDNFIATNDTAMRSLLGEFRDHGLVVSVAQGGPGSGELLWIPMRKERLSKILDALRAEQQE
ncbi:hypothetical protein HWV62_42203 [Athelia sp. TMB]|nr:hypothetical protein HWV62_42203 [Athelia sp. TMB]